MGLRLRLVQGLGSNKSEMQLVAGELRRLTVDCTGLGPCTPGLYSFSSSALVQLLLWLFLDCWILLAF